MELEELPSQSEADLLLFPQTPDLTIEGCHIQLFNRVLTYYHFSCQRFPFGCSTFACAFKFFPSCFNSSSASSNPILRVHIHCDRYIRMPHEVLQRLGIHSRFCHIRTIRVSAYMRCDVWHLHPVDVIVSADHMIEIGAANALPQVAFHYHRKTEIRYIRLWTSPLSAHLLNNRLKQVCANHRGCGTDVSGDY